MLKFVALKNVVIYIVKIGFEYIVCLFSQDIHDLQRDLWVQKRFNGFLWDLIVEEAIW